jgi:hypothetical protein
MRRLHSVVARRLPNAHAIPSDLSRRQRYDADWLDAFATHLDLAILIELGETDPFAPRPANKRSSPPC